MGAIKRLSLKVASLEEELEQKTDQLLRELDSKAEFCRGYARVAESALELALDAQARIRAMEATTHRINYVPSSVAAELKAMADKADGDDQKLAEQVKSYKNLGGIEEVLGELEANLPPDI